MRRIMVIGSSGAGKSTLSRRLAAALDLPLISLDAEHWLPGWREPSRDTWRYRVERLAERDAWIMDGNYGGSFDLRMPRAEAIVWLDYPRLLCAARALKRIATNFGRTREGMAEGCPERLDLKFIQYIWTFPRLHRPSIERAIGRFGGHAKIVRLTRDAEWPSLIAQLGGAARARAAPSAMQGA